MRIKNNISALNAQIALKINESKLSKDLEKLTSGYRINRSGDDAAGLAISEQMRSQIAGLTQGELNARDGIGLLRTGEGAMQEVHAMLIQLNGLAIRSANGVYTDEDHRELIQEEADRISEEIDRITKATRFNYVNLFHDDKSAAADSGIAPISMDGTDSAQSQSDAANAIVKKMAQDASRLPGNPKTADSGDPSQTMANDAGTYSSQAIAIAPDKVAAGGTVNTNAPRQNQTDVSTGFPGTKSMDASTGLPNTKSMDASTIFPGLKSMDAAMSRTNIGAKTGLDALATDTKAIMFQIGPNAEHTISIPRFYLSKEALGLDKLDVSSQEEAQKAIDKVDDMIDYVSRIRGTYGAVENALQHALNSMNIYKENITAAESRIRDTDMAKELTDRTKDNILAQTAQAMLAQANALPQSALSLLQQ